jgi:hypothetical protein
VSIVTNYEVNVQEGAAKESYIRHSTSVGASSFMASAATVKICSCQHTEWKSPEKKKSRHLKKRLQDPLGKHAYEGLLRRIQNILSLLDNVDKTHNPPPRVKKGWVRKDEIVLSKR